ncbi:YCII-related domain-containing protein [Chitinophaga polysaccharea]|uniref:YCII-related domain-containing protein n=1 Tax=Chitinophaga polysaccharea TaxID=1293035 RepID=A0A561PRI5_9BACT|nr:YciI family protein [Chitinophaga polysaccharea]TWF40720.1 YCII-related domain-containing protein [Chitinophaga polysaccharea]
MKDFLFVYRSDFSNRPQTSPEEMQANTKRWMDWIGTIAAQNKLTDRGNRLDLNGKVLRPNNMVTDGPYTEIKESLAGYSIVKASSLEEALELAKGCPILAAGGNVEVREISVM